MHRVATNRRARPGAMCVATTLPPPRLQIPTEPPRVPRRPPSRGSKRETLGDIAKRIPVHLMRQYFNYPLRAAAEAMHISVTTLKRLCRRHGVRRWPHRQISGINRALGDLESQHDTAEGEEIATVTEQLRQLHRRREVIIELAFESDDESAPKGCDAAPPAAHERVKRGSIISSDSGGSSRSSSAPSSPSHSRSTSVSSEHDIKPEPEHGEAWWNHPGGMDIHFAAAAAVAKPDYCSTSTSSSDGATGGGAGKCTLDGSSTMEPRPPRTITVTASAGKPTQQQRKPKSSALFSRITPPSAAAAAAAAAAVRPRVETAVTGTGIATSTITTTHRRKHGGDSSAAAPARAQKVARTTIPAPPRPVFAQVFVDSCCSDDSDGGKAGEGGGSVDENTCDMSVALLESADAAGACLIGGGSDDDSPSSSSGGGSSISNPLDPAVSEEIDDISVLGDLLFGPDETAAATAPGVRAQSLLAAHLNPGVFSYSASQCGAQGPCVPLCHPRVLSHDAFLVSASPLSLYEQGFSAGLASAAIWASGLGGGDDDVNDFTSVEEALSL